MEELVTEFDLAALVLGHNLVAGKWTVQILWYLNKGDKRFSELYKYFKYTSRSIFTKKLQELESAGLVERKVYKRSPVRVEYSLTDIGKKIIPVLDAMTVWSKEYIKTQKDPEMTDIEFIDNSFLRDKYKTYEGVPIVENKIQQRYDKTSE